jgi:D-amino-acid dehydrogenase
MHVCVMGAGIVGLSTAYALTQRGHRVTVVDQAEAGQGASGGNGAQLSYAYVQPMADPGIWAQLPQLLLSPSSALKIRPQWDPAQWSWLLQFLKACNTTQSQSTTAQLLHLAAQSRATLDHWRAHEALDFDFSSSGKLVMFRSAAAFAGARQQLALQQRLGGAPQQAVSSDEACAIEPALAPRRQAFAGGIYTDSECAADCLKLCQSLVQILSTRGVQWCMGHAVERLIVRERRLQAVQLRNGQDITADAFVLSTGHSAPTLAAQVGIRLPIYPLKGYSITVDTDGPSLAPRVSITDSARKVVFARLGDRLRVAGMVELVGRDTRLIQQRIDSLQHDTQDLFGDCSQWRDVQPWTGMRPATPTGLPILGRQAQGPSNLWLNAGHGGLGFTLAAGSAEQVAQSIDAQP